MTRSLLGVLVVAAFAGRCPAADPPKPAAAPAEFVLLDGDTPVRLAITAEFNGVPVSAVRANALAKLFAFFDRNADGVLDVTEAARLPSAKALRQALGSGFTPPSGPAPDFADLDRNGDGKVSSEELTAYYRAAGLGNVQVAVGRLPTSAELTAVVLKYLDTDGDGTVSEKEWQAAADTLRKLDKDDDELIGAGELVPKAVYPGAAGTIRLTPPTAGATPPEALAKLPLVMLPADPNDTTWAVELAKRNPRLKTAELTAWRKQATAKELRVSLSEKAKATERFVLAGAAVRVDGWVAAGKLPDAMDAARKQFLAQLVAPPAENGRRRAPTGLGWLIPAADRDGDGTLSRTELDAWLDLQSELGKGQAFVTVLDGGGLFELLDANHDGALSVRELRTAWDRLKAAGCVADGRFDPKNLPRVLLVAVSHGYPQSLAVDARRGPDWFRAMDRNGDGDVSRREFTGPAEVFDKLDLDKDGLLSADEAAKAGVKK